MGVMSIDHRDEPELPRAKLTTMRLDQRCVNCPWELTCIKDRTCWRLEPSSFTFTGALQFRAVEEARKKLPSRRRGRR